MATSRINSLLCACIRVCVCMPMYIYIVCVCVRALCIVSLNEIEKPLICVFARVCVYVRVLNDKSIQKYY